MKDFTENELEFLTTNEFKRVYEDMGEYEEPRRIFKKNIHGVHETEYRISNSKAVYYNISIPDLINPNNAFKLLLKIIEMKGITLIDRRFMAHEIEYNITND